MKIILNRSTIQVSIGDPNGIKITETIMPVDALRYAKTLRQLADQLIAEFPNEEEEENKQ